MYSKSAALKILPVKLRKYYQQNVLKVHFADNADKIALVIVIMRSFLRTILLL